LVDEGDDTRAFRPIEDTQAHAAISEETVVEEPPPPSGPPPRAVIDDIWPWLALLAGLAIAGLLVWLFVLRDDNSSKQTVPAVVGLQQQVAIEHLNSAGYNVKAIVAPAKKPQGIVVSQSPGGGSQLPKGSNVTLHVSNGAPPATPVTTTTTQTTTTTHTTTQSTTTVATPTSQVPDVSNTDLATAEGQIEAAGFVSEADPVDGSGTAGSVQDQAPSAGSQAPAGSVVRMSVVSGSDGGSVTVPNVVGKSGADARSALAQAKLTYKTVYKKGKPGIVLAQSPTGTQPAYTQVVLTVGQ
jgi:beta-lactam-binding protein with PASTA domain